MAQIIASMYEIEREIGSGGGGVVYLGRHIRLDKPVVLKADKRSLTAKKETLSREVNAMKNLNHTYIPHIYDYVEENGVVYTVMDYVEGESLDKKLLRGERFEQAQVIEWACELLEALNYLHTLPPHGILHSDIKPANIMLTPQGDIRLIDFNIALALDQEGAIRVGYSMGYASPEHYGMDYSGISATRMGTSQRTGQTGNATVLPPNQRPTTVLPGQNSQASKSGGRTILLDVRSDIYSLGATLYHLLSGHRPKLEAVDVIPLEARNGVSSAVAQIVNKAMAPDPAERFQTAAEMLWAFEHLHENDPRTKKLKRQRRIVTTTLATLFLCGGALAFAGNTQMRQAEKAARVVAEQQAETERIAKESEQNAKDALEEINKSRAAFAAGDTNTARTIALAALQRDTQYNSAAQYALTDALGVYDLSDGFKADKAVVLPSESIKQSCSPSGTYAAVLTSGQVNVIELTSGTVIAELPANVSALSDIMFTPDDVLLYAGKDALCAYDAAEKKELWHTEARINSIAISGDGLRAAAIREEDDAAIILNVKDGEIDSVVSFNGLKRGGPVNAVFADPENDIFAMDNTGRYLAVSFANGALKIFDTTAPDDEIEIFDESKYTVFEGGFYDRFFGFVASDRLSSEFFALDMSALKMVGSMAINGEMHLRVDGDGFCLSQGNVLVRLDVNTGEQSELAFTESGVSAISRFDGMTLVKASDGKLLFYDSNAILFDKHDDIDCDFIGLAGQYAVLTDRDSPSVRILKLKSHADQQLLTYDTAYTHDEARVHTNHESAMLYDYHGFRLYGMDGSTIAEQVLPDAEQVYDQQYRRGEDGDYLEVIYNDGRIRQYSAVNGELFLEEQEEQKNSTLDEEFLTEHLRIVSPLHGTPVVYDRESGEQIRELESEDYLVYATDVEGGIITEYITSQGRRYGLLLDEKLETLAYLPNLCDVLPDNSLVFDDGRGNLRESKLYSQKELESLARTLYK